MRREHGVSFHFAYNLTSDLLLIYYYTKLLQCSTKCRNCVLYILLFLSTLLEENALVI